MTERNVENKLYVGVNYHPHDWPASRWETDILLMREAGFTTVRLGHLCWDCFEPENGRFTFVWFDGVMDLFAQAGIGVVLDLSVHPAPVWVHRECPGCTLYGKSGTPAPAVRRYMEDVLDPDYQRYALRFAHTLAKRYASHPALFAFGLCNEQGAGYLNHSPWAKARFQAWLKEKYHSVDMLNAAWATQRWSRRVNAFDEIELPENEVEKGSPEAWMDMRRFFSDGIAQFLRKLKETVEAAAPGIPHTSNHYSGHDGLGFDYLKYRHDFVDYPGMGFYPDYAVNEKTHYALTVLQERRAEFDKPLWCIEFISGLNGQYAGPKGSLRMLAFLSILYGAQMILGWTWRTMLHGEEQFFYGLLDHAGMPTPAFEEYREIARDCRKLSAYGFPRRVSPQIAVAFQQENQWIGQYHPHQFRQPYSAAIICAQRALFEENRDYNMVHLGDMEKEYKLLIVPDCAILTEGAAREIRYFVEAGGHVWMTGYSAMLKEDIGAFDSPRPGMLDDVFGLRVAGFTRAGDLDEGGYPLPSGTTIQGKNSQVTVDIQYREHLVLTTASSLAVFPDGSCAVAVNGYGKGKAWYLAPEANADLLRWLLEETKDILGLYPQPVFPAGIQGRIIGENRLFVLNTTNQPITVPLPTLCEGALSGTKYENEIFLTPYDGELLLFTVAEGESFLQFWRP
ncbi:MAG: beta-galactosidase [Clostridia bacterium]|nr:beta-galactosidase [Clostridia bacterium]